MTIQGCPCDREHAKQHRKQFSEATVTGKIVSLMLNAYLKTAKTQSCHSLIIQYTV